MRGWKILAISLLLILAVLGATACGPSQSQNEQQVQVAKGNITLKVNGSGKVGVDTDANPSFGNGGHTIDLYF